MTIGTKSKGLLASALVLAGAACLAPAGAAAQATLTEAASCDRYLAPKSVDPVNGKRVGHEACRMRELDITYGSRPYRRIDMGVTGTVAGYTMKTDAVRDWGFNAYPEFAFPQSGFNYPIFHGIGRYDMSSGSALTILYPRDRAAWNGKMFVTAHGAGRDYAKGTLKDWDKNLDPSDPMRDISKYERLMLDKGYAVAKTWRSTAYIGGDIIVTLDDGTIIRNRNAMEQPKLIIGFSEIAANVFRDRLGKKPTRTYWYGHSGGARAGRMMNYKGLNADSGGRPIIDGLITDDVGAGMFLPIVMKDGRDVQFTTDAERQRFIPTIEVSHLIYDNETPDELPPFRRYNNFLANKRINAQLLKDKGLWNRFRYYEVDGVSHQGGEYLADGKGEGDVQILDLSRLMDGFIDMLDAWVDRGVQPPPVKSDWVRLTDQDKDGPLRLPDVACPLGVFHILPRSAGPGGMGTTGFAAFDGDGLEPDNAVGGLPVAPGQVNSYRGYADMNRNGYKDFRETMTEAWRRLGLLKAGEPFGRPAYEACVDRSVAGLLAEKFVTPKVADLYRTQAKTIAFPSN